VIWVIICGADGRALLICPAVDAQLWWFLEGEYYWRYRHVPEAA
jgi:hypothetical protein